MVVPVPVRGLEQFGPSRPTAVEERAADRVDAHVFTLTQNKFTVDDVDSNSS